MWNTKIRVMFLELYIKEKIAQSVGTVEYADFISAVD